MSVIANSSINIKCTFPRFVTVQWVHNDAVLDTDSGERIVSEREDKETGVSESWLLIEDLDDRDLGTYWCQNKNNPAMGDYVVVALRAGATQVCFKVVYYFEQDFFGTKVVRTQMVRELF